MVSDYFENDERLILKNERVSTNKYALKINTIVLTNKNIIYIKKRILSEDDKKIYRLDDIKVVDRIVQVYIDDFDKKKVSILFTRGSLEIYFRSSIEAFKWKNTIKFQYEKKEENMVYALNNAIRFFKKDKEFYCPSCGAKHIGKKGDVYTCEFCNTRTVVK